MLDSYNFVNWLHSYSSVCYGEYLVLIIGYAVIIMFAMETVICIFH